ncbi:caspase family protein [filamentous cyanobacterium LEGE 11480]|uniref:Caspase family protein n=1 Tax=Romeriopsis navalis LEGE 11480 TaxID=2777977 RepID=A0A928VVT0_9CYAN|nr:caspase family protein [Romeriopsis navalis]MBE9032964.1 caspase family protein [Romeriopsis navalis LEGE 11480]
MRRTCRSLLCLVVASLGLTTGLSSCIAAHPRPFSPSAVLDEIAAKSPGSIAVQRPTNVAQTSGCAAKRTKPDFLVFGGGGAPSYNEIAIEKNVLYFQRTLKALKLTASQSLIYFANGNNGEKTIRFIDPQTQKQRFKAHEITGVRGPATWTNLRSALTQAAKSASKSPLFFYFTGHGNRNRRNVDNNTMILWNEHEVTVQDWATQLDRFPPEKPVVTVMVQCFAGAFANFIYEKGDPKRPVAPQTRCGFFATIKYRPSVGCTPEVNEADYEDYSSSFFAGLSGMNRVGQPVAAADYDQDGRVTYMEAHAFAKIDEQASDLPISTSEAWLRNRADRQLVDATMAMAIEQVLKTARPEQRYVVEAISQKFRFDRSQSFLKNVDALPVTAKVDELPKTYLTRLQLELINIAAERAVRSAPDKTAIQVLDRLLNCESGSWH